MNPPPASQGVWFPDWAAALSRLSLKELERTAYRRAITSYLHFCRESRRRATVASAREFMRRLEGVSGGMKVEENKRFEIPFSSWGFSSTSSH